MRAVLLIAYTFFSVVPLQRLLGAISGVMILAGLATRALAHGRQATPASLMLLFLGTALLALVPAMMGGGMMRSASSRVVLHQLPWGRQRMLLGATLAITALAGLVATMHLLAASIPAAVPLRKDPFSAISTLEMFGGSWAVFALLWVTTFITSGSRILSVLIGFLPLGLITLSRRHTGSFPEVPTLFAASAVAWAAFSLWYLRVPAMRTSIYSPRSIAAAAGSPFSGWVQSITGAMRPTGSRKQAIELIIQGTASRLSHVLLGVCFLLAAGVMGLIMRFALGNSTRGQPIPALMPLLIFMPALLMTSGSIGYVLTRRARMLWLRAGLDRPGLFATVERSGLIAGIVALGISFTGVTLFAVTKWPDRSAMIGAFAVAQFLFCFCLFYAGMSLTRGWAAVDVLLGSGLLALLAVEVLALRPWSDTHTAVTPVLVALALLVPVLRWHARRRWLTLDWRVARMLQLPRHL